jgi:Flp pilus assembly pilin Flp
MKNYFNKFLRDEDGNNLVVGLIILGIVALPLVFWLTGLVNSSRDRASDEADQIFNEETGSQYSPGGMAALDVDELLEIRVANLIVVI